MLEQAVEDLLLQAGYDFVPSAALFFAMRDLEQPIYTRQCETGLNIYGKRRKVDFILYHPRKWPDSLVIQCKWQAATGSVDEKYPFEVLSIQADGYPAIFILDGAGYSPAAAQWLKGQAGKNCLKHVFTLGDFQRFASRGQL
ncbi:MAG: hypothetical protein OXH77_05535 [Anaerolineaceae bacterium]|nr:hypothetical protein [Anaerolineaceae bacterium]